VAFDALLVLSFGGPEGPDDVRPFLENVLRGRPASPDRIQEVAAHYQQFGGVSPLNEQNRQLVVAIREALTERHRDLPVYWGNRNWHPFLADAVRQMRADGIRHAAAFVTAAYASYSSCRQYLDNLAEARAIVGPGAPEIVKLRPYFNQPGFVEPLAAGLRAARAQAGREAPVLMTAHSIPAAMAATCAYEEQLRETARLVADIAGEPTDCWTLVFQSRSGPPQERWLEPDISDAITALPNPPASAIVVPIGFVSDHMEVVYDLDRVAAATAAARGVRLLRSPTPGCDPRFVSMILDLVEETERRGAPSYRRSLGPEAFPASVCPAECCPPPATGVQPESRSPAPGRAAS
jgi:ferrochelatase